MFVSSSDRLHLEAAFTMEKANVFVGGLVMQELELSESKKTKHLTENRPFVKFSGLLSVLFL